MTNVTYKLQLFSEQRREWFDWSPTSRYEYDSIGKLRGALKRSDTSKREPVTLMFKQYPQRRIIRLTKTVIEDIAENNFDL